MQQMDLRLHCRTPGLLCWSEAKRLCQNFEDFARIADHDAQLRRHSRQEEQIGVFVRNDLRRRP